MVGARSSALRVQPEHDRPRERLAALGAAALSDAELVAIQLGSGSRGENAVALAQRLIAVFGGMAGLARADPDELARHHGVGMAKACRLVSAFALADRRAGPSTGLVLRTSSDLADVTRPMIGRARVEKVALVLMDTQSRVIRVLPVAQGGVAGCAVPVREVLSLALRHDAVSIAVAHNHPSGSTAPSPADKSVTRRLQVAAGEVGLRLLDHIVVTTDSWCSLTASR